MGWIDQRTGRTGGRPPRVVAALLPEPLHHCHNEYLVDLDSASNNLNGLLNAINKLNVGVRVTSASN